MPPTFFCTLCQKGYARSNELEAHENSYDHQHKKRLKEMKAMTRPTTFGPPRKRDSDMVMSANTKSDPPAKKGGGFKPIGSRIGAGPAHPHPQPIHDTPSAAADGMGAVPRALAVDHDSGKEVEDNKAGAGDEYVTVTGPIAWERLDAVTELVNLDHARPREMQKLVDAQRRHLALRRDVRFYEGIWEKVIVAKRLRDVSESPPPALGLGA